MTQFKTLIVALAVLASVAFFSPALAVTVVSSSEADQVFDAVGEASASLAVGPSTELTIFVSGTYSVANTVVLQEEKGSPGSGVFKTVLTLDTDTANARQVLTFKTKPNDTGYRLLMTAFGTGDVVAYMTDKPRAAVQYGDGSHYATHNVWFDDFEQTYWETDADSVTLVSNQLYLTLGDADNGGILAVHDISGREGVVSMSSNTDENDMQCFGGLLPANQASLVSDGITIFEVRVNVAAVTSAIGIGMHDTVCSDTTVWLTAVAGTVASDGTGDSQIFMFQTDAATNSSSWLATSAIADVEGGNALEVVAAAVTAAEYHIVRVETDAAGNGYFFYDNVLVHAEPLAVTTTVELLWQIFTESSSAASAAVLSSFDYIMWARPRPSTPST